MTTISKLLRESADVALPVLQGITDEQLTAAPPCAEFRVGDLVKARDALAVGLRDLGFDVPHAQGNFVWLPGGQKQLPVYLFCCL